MPDHDAPLSLESAVSILTAAPADDQNQNNPPADSTAGDNAPPADNAATGEQPPADNTAPADTQDTPADQGETKTGDGDQGDALPPIEAPASWSTEEKAEWNSLSRKAQETILRREQDNTKALRTAQNATAESNKKVEAEVTRLSGLAAQMDTFVNEKVAELTREFPEIKSEADLVALATNDPARKAIFDAKLQAIAAANNAKAEADKIVQQKAEEKRTADYAAAKDALLEAFPAWKDPDVARREVTEIQDYAIKMGVPEAAARACLDPNTYKLAHKAMLYDRAQESAAKALTRTPPRTIQPGANVNPGQAAKDQSRRANLAQLDKTGDIEDAMKLMLQ